MTNSQRRSFGAPSQPVLDNGNVPQLPTLSRSDAAAMEAFLQEMLLIYLSIPKMPLWQACWLCL